MKAKTVDQHLKIIEGGLKNSPKVKSSFEHIKELMLLKEGVYLVSKSELVKP